MKSLCLPESKHVPSSKLAMTLKHVGWEQVELGQLFDIGFWVSDGACFDNLLWNHRFTPMDKARVGYVFSGVFGYWVDVDPKLHHGPCVKKRLGHGVHGTVVMCPQLPESGYVYQKLLQNNKSHTEELRLDILGREMLVTVKCQVKQANGMPQEHRTDDSSAFDVDPTSVLSRKDADCVWDFCRIIGLDHGGIDAIRHTDGRLYIIDATTNVGVPEMSWHRNLTLKQYLDRTGEVFVRNFTPK